MKYVITGRLSIEGPRIARMEVSAKDIDEAARVAVGRFFARALGAYPAACNTSRAAGIFYPRYDFRDELAADEAARHSGAMLTIRRENA